MPGGVEARRSARIAAGFWVAVEGVDAEMVLRHGDISATGMFFEVDSDIGDVGTIQWLHIASSDRTRTIHVMAHIVRVVSLADVHRAVRGVALEFMPESDDAAANLCDFVQHVLETPREGKPALITPRVNATAAAGEAAASTANVEELSVRTLLLETDWSVPVGEPVRVEIISRGVRRPIRVEGHAVSVLPASTDADAKKRYRIAVRVKGEINGPLRRFSSMELAAVNPDAVVPPPSSSESQLEQLLSALIKPSSEPSERKHLAGLLSRIPFSALCSLLELERLMGVLTIRRADEEVRLFVRDGRFVDVETTKNTPPREVVASLLETRHGSFDFVVKAVTNEDRLNLSMTQVLLDVARERDESKRVDDPGHDSGTGSGRTDDPF